MKRLKFKRSGQYGFSLIEVVVVIALIAVLSGVALANLRELHDPVRTGASQLSGFIKQVRSRAMSATQAFLIQPTASDRVVALRANTCSAETWTPDSRLVLDLPSGVSLTDLDWDVCISSRGLPDDNVAIELNDLDGRQRVVELLLGGAVRVY